MKKIFLILSLLLTLASTQNYALENSLSTAQFCEIDDTTLNIVEDKIYFSPDQVIVSNEGLYVLISDINGHLIRCPISNLHHDSSGIFVLVEELHKGYYEKCRACLTRLCENCHKCLNRGCVSGRTCRCRG